MRKKFLVEGMTCASCQAHVERAVGKLPGVKECRVSLLTNSMDVEWEDGAIQEEDILLAVSRGGYRAIPEGEGDKPAKPLPNSKKHGFDKELGKLIAGIFFLLLLMYVSMGPMIGIPLPAFLDGEENALLNVLLQALLTVPSLILFGHYLKNGILRLLHLEPNMDSLVAIGSLSSLVYGLYAIFRMAYGLGHGDMGPVHDYMHSLYFDSAAMILTFVSLGKYLEGLSKRKTTKAIESLMDLAPKKAVLRRDGEEREIPVEEVRKGDLVIVRKGALVPVDGKIVEGQGSLMEANITGESMPRLKGPGETVYSSAILEAGYLEIEAEKVGEDTSIEQIIRLVKEASDSKAPISRLADRISLYFVPAVILLSLLVFLGWIIATGDFETSFNFAVSVLVIACPCALGLATPVAIMVSSGKGAQAGLLIRNAEILERSSSVGTVLFDKTGTITEGRMKVTDYILLGEEDPYPLLAALERRSEHPLASSILDYRPGTEELHVEKYVSLDGVGLVGVVEGRKVLAGNARAFKDGLPGSLKEVSARLSSEGKTVLYVLVDGEAKALLALKDVVKPGAKEAIHALSSKGIRTVMLTGDNRLAAESIAREVGIDEVRSEVLPAEKAEVVASFKKGGGPLVAMVGDGVNDAIALSASDIGIAIGAGSDVAKESADIVLLRGDLMDVANAFSLSRRTLHTIRLGLFWALIYNLVGIFLATGALYYPLGIALSPMIGSLAMSLSSVFVVMNALTINLWKPIRGKEGGDCSLSCPVGAEEKKGGESMETIEIKVEGMMCQMCVKHVKEALLALPGVEDAEVSLEGKKALVRGKNLSHDALVEAVTKAGYKAE